MAGASLTLVIAGDQRVIPLKPVGMMAAERKFGGQAFEEHPVEASMLAAWVSLGKPYGDFEEWCATVDEMVPPSENGNGQDPTLATPPEASQLSPPAPA